MLRKSLIGVILFSLIFIVVACTAPTPTPTPNPKPNPKPSGPIKATWIEPQIVGDTVSIPVSEVENNWNVHFNVKAQGGDMNFMAYVLDGEISVRANVCPPCRSIGFSLEEAVLICDRCATTFKAETGGGMNGACVDFPKASVPYEIKDGNVVMKGIDVIAAYQDTIEPGWP
jgi:nitrite reductase/ring-hydroxylating ferredoxin subunit